MVRLAVVGDVHGQWTPADAACLRFLAPDAVLWVGESELPPSLLPPPTHTLVICSGGAPHPALACALCAVGVVQLYRWFSVCAVYAGDIGNEDVSLVQQIAALVSPFCEKLLVVLSTLHSLRRVETSPDVHYRSLTTTAIVGLQTTCRMLSPALNMAMLVCAAGRP